ncbi:hypothetical protein I3842_05G115300 [Carya illinoinensis]|uniref:Uncharacterized protein n=1 Tax=Carya illinoinensis TaxID=32201 RepID=A0A922EYH8_CARIL|nr:hypothetical protein I3842_05G115300 [Carya illinoinensis]
MIPFKLLLHQSSSSFSIPPNTPLYLYPPPPQFPNPALPPPLHKPTLSLRPNPFSLSIRLCNPEFRLFKVSKAEAPVTGNEGGYTKASPQVEDLSPDGAVYRKTLALVECSMFAALTGLVYFLSNSLAIENYFGCVFSLPIVISSMRWGIAAGRKTMVATAMLLLVLSGPVKALTYLLKHGIVGLTMGSLWRLGANWSLSIVLCTIVRAVGAVGYVLITSFLIRENIFALITINIHASLAFIFTASGLGTIPSMNFIYALFTILVLLNSGCFIFLLHILYSVFLTRLGMKASLRLPRWIERAI